MSAFVLSSCTLGRFVVRQRMEPSGISWCMLSGCDSRLLLSIPVSRGAFFCVLYVT